jgi:hypothetical protein
LEEEASAREKLREENERRELELKLQQEAAAQLRQIQEEHRRKEQEKRERQQRKESLQRSYDDFLEALQTAQKKVKRLKKKLREIVELEERLASSKTVPSKDQLQKIEKQQEVRDDIMEAEEEEEKLLERQESGEFNELLNWQEDEPTSNGDGQVVVAVGDEPPQPPDREEDKSIPQCSLVEGPREPRVERAQSKRSDDVCESGGAAPQSKKGDGKEKKASPKTAVRADSWTTVPNKTKKKVGKS